MTKPKSFKDILNFKSKSNKKEIVFTKAPPVQISPEVLEKRRAQKEELKKFANDLRCEVCGAQLDGAIYYSVARLHCVADNQHYQCSYLYGSTYPSYCYRTYNFHPDSYVVSSFYTEKGNYNNSIHHVDLTMNEIYRHKCRKLITSYEGPLPEYEKNISEEDFRQMLKMCAVFN